MSSDEELQAPYTEPIGKADEIDRPLTISSQDLLQGRREIWIEHDRQLYRLRVTSRGKLYLTK